MLKSYFEIIRKALQENRQKNENEYYESLQNHRIYYK